jgi:transcriptional regulator with XRE-family HTH domain
VLSPARAGRRSSFVVVFTQQEQNDTKMNTPHKNFAEFFKSLRRERRITLRDFCIAAGADPGNISRMERGAMVPPQDREILTRYAQALNLAEGSDEWYLFFDLAAADRGMIPKDLMDDAEVVKRLPAFFRTLRGQRPTEKELRKIVEKIKRS